jgi:hypothetical protein
MVSPVIPVVKSLYVCDDVARDPSSGKVSVLNLWDTVRPPPGATFPYSLAKLCVFAWMREGRGRVRSRIDIVQAVTHALIGRTADCVLDFTLRTTHFARYRFAGFRFPEPGYYYVELYCENAFIDDQVVRVLPA